MAKKDLGHSEHSRQGKLTFGSTWKVYGPVGHKATVLDAGVLAKGAPPSVSIDGKLLKARTVSVAGGKLNFNKLFGKHYEGRTAYAVVPFTAPKAGRYTLGLGADWWLESWVDGKPVGDTLAIGNGQHPPTSENNAFNIDLDEGRHTLAVRAISGTGGHTLAVGSHSQAGLDNEENHQRQAVGIAKRLWRPIKVVFMGAGSGFLGALVNDVMSMPGADEGEFALVDIDPVRLDLAEKVCHRIVEAKGNNWKITATTDRRKVLKGADYVINCIEVSGMECVVHDNDIPLKYGIDQCIGDTIGPGGVFKALRTVPVFLQVLADMEKLCPNAWVLNYTNPMSIMCLAAARSSRIRVVGLCHSVQGASHSLAAWAGVPYHEMKWTCAGVNHLAWFTSLTHMGRDLYPRIKERYRKEEEFRNQDIVRKDLMMHFGYYCTESSGHDSEYLPYYRKNADVMKRYCRDGYEGGTRFYASNWPQWRKNTEQNRRDQANGKAPINMGRSWEYASAIIQAIETNDSCVIYGSMPNNGLISNLPQDGVVEVACLCDAYGIRPTYYGKLPSQCAALCDWNMRCFDLAADACINRSIETAAHALMLDPLCAAVSCPADIRKMTFELFEAEKKYLPGFKA